MLCTNESQPLVTVLMSVFNGEQYLRSAMDSILTQTVSNIRVIVVDDASTDTTPSILQACAEKDSRIQIITNTVNQGLTRSLNIGLEHVTTPFVARMDADDICMPVRIESQLRHMQLFPHIVALGSFVLPVDASGARVTGFLSDAHYVTDHNTLKRQLYENGMCLFHPTLVLRTEALRRIGGYRVCFRYAQDYDMLLRILEIGQIEVLPQELLQYRVHAGAISAHCTDAQKIANVTALASAILRAQGQEDGIDEAAVIDERSMLQLAERAGAWPLIRLLQYFALDASADCEKGIQILLKLSKTKLSPEQFQRVAALGREAVKHHAAMAEKVKVMAESGMYDRCFQKAVRAILAEEEPVSSRKMLKKKLKTGLMRLSPSGNVYHLVRQTYHLARQAYHTIKFGLNAVREQEQKHVLDLIMELLDDDRKRNPGTKTILLVTNQILDTVTFKPTYGGGERYLRELVSLFDSLGFTVTILQANAVSSLEIRSVFGCRVLCVPSRLDRSGFFVQLNRLAFKLAGRVDHVVYFLPETGAPVVAGNSLLISHGIWFDHANYAGVSYRTRLFWKRIKTAFTAPAHCVSVDTNTIGLIRSLWPVAAQKWHFIPNFYDPDQFRPVPLKGNPSRLTVLFPRRAQVNRGAYVFGDIVKAIPHDTVSFIWAGRGDEASNNEIERVCAEDGRCMFTSADFEGMAELYAQADIVVIPTIACEGTSLSLIEALASGRAVVTTHVGGLADIALDGFNCLVADPTAASIAACVTTLIEDAGLRSRLAQNAAQSVSGLALPVWRERWLRLLQQIGWADVDACLRAHASYAPGRNRKRLVILTRNACVGGVESLIHEEQKALAAPVVVCGGLDAYETCPFTYQRADDPGLLAGLLSEYDAVLCHWIPDWAQQVVKPAGKPAVEFIHMATTSGNDSSVPELFVSHSPYMARYVEKYFLKPCRVVPHAIDDSRFVPNPVPGTKIGAVCAYVQHKGIDTFIQAWSGLHQKYPQIEAAFYGDGPYREALQSLASELHTPVALNPATSAPEEVMREYRLIVLPSRNEGLPVMVLEALALNIPVITTALPWALEFNALAESRGVPAPLQLVPADDPEALCTAIDEMLETPASTSARSYIQHYYSPTVHAQALADAFKSIGQDIIDVSAKR